MDEKLKPEALSAKIDIPNVGFHRYNEQKNSHSLFCFMEGKYDPDYYLGIIRSICGDDIIIINCGRKSNVLDIYNRVFLSDHIQYRLAFFIDRDFDELINDPNIFETDRYSIENYYCTRDVFERILKYEFGVPDDAAYRDTVLSFYDSEFNAFHNTVDLFNAFYSLLHKFEREHNVTYCLNLDENFPTDLANINVGQCVKHYSLQDLLNKYRINNEVMSDDEVEAERIRLWSLNPFIVFRGKYEKEFLFRLLQYLITDANKGKLEAGIIKKKISCTLNGVRFMSNFAQYAYIPDNLRNYLSRFSIAA